MPRRLNASRAFEFGTLILELSRKKRLVRCQHQRDRAGGPSFRPGKQWKRSLRRRDAAKRPKRKPFLPDFLPLDQRMMLSTFNVTDTSDSASDTGSLRYALMQSNDSGPGPNTIDFEIPKSDSGFNMTTGVWTIDLTSDLPQISVPVLIDGSSQSGYATAPLIDLDGTSAGADATGLSFTNGSDFSTVEALVINNFAGTGIDLAGGDSNTIEGCYIGTNSTGTAAESGSMTVGIDVLTAFNTIGGVTSTPGTGAGNVISGTSSAGIEIDAFSQTTLVIGNAIGTNASGTAAVPNGTGVLAVDQSGSATIGGTTSGTANLISGNSNAGIEITGVFAGADAVEGNLIGTDVTGSLAVPNTSGVEIDTSASESTIGGSVGGAGNLISGNLGAGVEISDASYNDVWGNVIGLNLAGNATLGNYYGVRIDSDSANNTIGGREFRPSAPPSSKASPTSSRAITFPSTAWASSSSARPPTILSRATSSERTSPARSPTQTPSASRSAGVRATTRSAAAYWEPPMSFRGTPTRE